MRQRRYTHLLVLIASVGLLGASCSGTGDKTGGATEDTGSVAMQLTLADGASVASVTYVFSGGPTSLMGTVDTSKSATISATLGPLVAGDNYMLQMTATADAGYGCSGSAGPFPIKANKATPVTIVLTCHSPRNTGTATVNGKISVCPGIDALTASPSEVLVGNDILLTAKAGPDDKANGFPIKYNWTGVTSSDLVGNAIYHCNAGGSFLIALTVSNGNTACTTTPADPAMTASLTVTCTGPAAPTGTVVPNHAVLTPDGKSLYVSYADQPGPGGMTKGGIFKLDTATNTWANVSPAGKTYGYSGVTLDAQHPQTLMAAVHNVWNGPEPIFRSTNGGVSWVDVNASSVLDYNNTPWIDWHQGTRTVGGGWDTGLAIDPFNSDHALIGCGDGVFASRDLSMADTQPGSITHWFYDQKNFEQVAIQTLVSPPSGPALWSGMSDLGGFRHDDVDVSPAGGVFNNPRSWQVSGIDFAQSNPNFVVRVDNGPSYGSYSNDGGSTWQVFASIPTGGKSGDIAVSADASTLVWTYSNGSYYSKDTGKTWAPTVGVPKGISIWSDRVNPNKFYAANIADNADGAIYVSTDGGVTYSAGGVIPKGVLVPGWNAWNSGLRVTPGIEGDMWVFVGALGWVGGAKLYHSVDSGATFTPVTSIKGVGALGFGMAAPGAAYPAMYARGVMTIAGTDVTGFFRSDDSGATWVRINDNQHQYGTSGKIAGDPKVYGRIYIGNNGRGIIYGDNTPSSTGPYTWKSVVIHGGGFVTGFVFHPREKDLYYARTDMGGAYRYNAADSSWIPITDMLAVGDYNGVESIALDPTDPNKVYMACGTYTADWANAHAMLRSNDRGATWSMTDVTSLFKMGANESGRNGGERLIVDPNLPSRLFMGTRKKGLWKSEDSGVTWTNVPYAFPQDTGGVGIIYVIIDPTSGTPGHASQTIYAGVSVAATGLYRSLDGGATWSLISTPM